LTLNQIKKIPILINEIFDVNEEFDVEIIDEDVLVITGGEIVSKLL
jgi:hypothetical protein